MMNYLVGRTIMSGANCWSDVGSARMPRAAVSCGEEARKEAFSSQVMLNHVMEEELLHLQQRAAGLGSEFGPGTAQALE